MSPDLSTITMLTDFGGHMGYVGQMKGVMRSINPKAHVIDLSHDVAPQAVLQAAVILEQSMPYFPPHTIHLVVIDPGVGTAREAIVIETDNAFFVGPNNGLFGFLKRYGDVKGAHIISNSRLMLAEQSSTFHGRDIFAPAAAYLSLGRPISDFGPAADQIYELAAPVREFGRVLEGEVVAIDRFGNLITSIRDEHLAEFSAHHPDADLMVWCHGEPIALVETYGQVARGHLLAYMGSGHHLEVAVNQGNAAQWFNAHIGSKIKVSLHIDDASGLEGE